MTELLQCVRDRGQPALSLTLPIFRAKRNLAGRSGRPVDESGREHPNESFGSFRHRSRARRGMDFHPKHVARSGGQSDRWCAHLVTVQPPLPKTIWFTIAATIGGALIATAEALGHSARICSRARLGLAMARSRSNVGRTRRGKRRRLSLAAELKRVAYIGLDAAVARD